MVPKENMPADPLAALEESRMQRDIAAIDWKKENEGTTWAQYLGGTLVLFGMNESFSDPVMRNRVQRLADMVPRLQEAERLNSPGFPGIKREVVQSVHDALTVERELMDTSNAIKEEK